MIGFLRRHQPRNPALAVVFWLILVALVLAILFTLFFFLGDYLPWADPGVVDSVPAMR
jgi:hypothetical protein